ncbi:hypothetical protein GCM10011348_03380 [Marinobacterium nitratireducens]|uniref:Uncharacterized protein n=1 Tax=Marinobacterium nitratireducens TaxID=518897 RepID=A0A917Z954_9GAMM|nr:hypothetical protein GCM10011348_03380 [Marinobacterium nitratireducens]
MLFPDNHAIRVTFKKLISGPIDKSTAPRPAITMGVKANVAKMRGADTKIAFEKPETENNFGA